jgi:hypothetical protein
MRMRAAAAAFAVAFEEANSFAQRAMVKVIEDWKEQVEECAKDPSYAAVTDARTMSAEEASYFTKVADGICFSYLCRKKKCMFFGGNNVETWVKKRKSYHFRCPMCGYMHRPWATEEDDIPAKRVLTIVDPLSGELMHIPTENPASEDDRFINQMIEVTARDIKSDGDLQKWFSKASSDVQEWLKKESICRSWEMFVYNPKQHTAHVDSRLWDDSRQKTRGFVMGSCLTDIESAQQPFTDFNGLISVFANHVAASRAFSLSSKL